MKKDSSLVMPCGLVNIGKHLPVDIALYPRRLKFSSTLLWESADLTVNTSLREVCCEDSELDICD